MLSITDLTKRYGDETVLDEISLSVDRGEFVTLLGPSGCGKTTTVLAIAGHVEPTSGEITVDGRDVTRQPPEERSIGVVFQEGALFPHMTARENVAYALGPHSLTDSGRQDRVERYLSLVGMSNHGEKYPEQLSGGQRRRVELARALVYEPDVLLLDEPLSGLDRQLRAELRGQIARIHEETDVTTLYVTHDQSQALTLSDRVVVLHDGSISAAGDPRDLYEQPPNRFVATFLGTISRLQATVRDADAGRIEWAGCQLQLAESIPADRDALPIYLRPESIESSLSDSSVRKNVSFEGEIAEMSHTGSSSTITVRGPESSRLTLSAPGFVDASRGDMLTVGFDADALFGFAADQRVEVEAVLATTQAELQE